MQALDDLVEAVVNKLQSNVALDNTYLVFTSDNGWHQGEHRIMSGKGTPYEESIRDVYSGLPHGFGGAGADLVGGFYPCAVRLEAILRQVPEQPLGHLAPR